MNNHEQRGCEMTDLNALADWLEKSPTATLGFVKDGLTKVVTPKYLLKSDVDWIIAQARAAASSQAGVETATPAQEVVVKPLEWERYWGGSGEQYRSWRPTNNVSNGFYRIDMDGDNWTDGTCDAGRYPSLDAAKAAAQANFEQRIRSASVLSTPAPAQQGPDPIWKTELSEIIGHLGSAIVQSTNSDDRIIMDHVRAAYEIAKVVRRQA